MTLPRRWFLISGLLCAALASLTFIPGLSGAFVLDDLSNIVNNPAVHPQTLDSRTLARAAFSPQPGGITRVIPMLTFALDYCCSGGVASAVFNATIIALNAITTIRHWLSFRQCLLSDALPHRTVPFR